MVVVFAIEPRVYCEAIGQTIQALRPHLEVIVLEPGTLEAGVAGLDPHLVFSNLPVASSSSGGPAWVEFRPYEEPPVRVCLAGSTWELEEVEFSDLLSLVDEAERLSRTRRDLGDC